MSGGLGSRTTAPPRYRTIVADPPWPYGSNVFASGFKKNGSKAVTVDMPYPPMSIDAICSLAPPAQENAHLYLWTTNAFMDEAHDVVRAWGFVPKTICTYGKVTPEGRPSARTGYYFRGATEHVLFGVRGSLPLQVSEAVATLWLWPRLPHSVKPDAFYDLVERVSPGPYLELFARRARFGWDYWGDESLGTAEMEVVG